MKDIRQNPNYAKYLTKIGWRVERVGGSYIFIKHFPFGNFIKLQRPEKLTDKLIETISEKYKPFKIVVEPLNTQEVNILCKKGFTLSQSPYLPTKTLHIDLTKTIDTIFSQVKKDARSYIGRNNTPTTKEITDIPCFHRAYRNAKGLWQLIPSLANLQALKSSFGSSALFLTSHNIEKKIISGAIFIATDDRVYYWQAFNSNAGRSALAQYKLVWQGILWAKKNKKKVFDFEGIFDERFPLPSWKGFSHFKKSFGGYEVSYPGCYQKVIVKNLFRTAE